MQIKQSIKIQFTFVPLAGEPITNKLEFNKLKPIEEWTLPEKINCGCVYEFTELPSFQEYQKVISIIWYGILQTVALEGSNELQDVTTKVISQTTMVTEDSTSVEPFIVEPVEAPVVTETPPSNTTNTTSARKRTMSVSAEATLSDCFYEANTVVPSYEEVLALFGRIPEEIHVLARQWGWSDTEVRDAVFVFLMTTEK